MKKAGSLRLVILVLLVTASPIMVLDHATECVYADYDSALKKAVDYLAGQYNPDLGLCRESPQYASNIYWLVSDNLWACVALKDFYPNISQSIESRLKELAVHHGLHTDTNGLPIGYKHEAVIGDTIPLPFHNSLQYILESNGYTIKLDIANSTDVCLEWQEFADLLLYASLSYYYKGQKTTALWYFNKAEAMWDGKGIWDKHAQGFNEYSTYKLALLLYVSKRLNVVLTFEEELIDRIYKQQDQFTGGIITEYRPDGTRRGYANTETTSIVVIALMACIDVAVVNVEPYKIIMGQNSTTKIDVTVSSLGGAAGSFNVTLYANATVIQTQTRSLLSGTSANVTFNWNATDIQLGNYTLRAEASRVDNETILTNNELTDGMITISIPGDINADGKVNILDISLTAKAYNSRLGDEIWDSNADVNEDGTINILDISAIAKEYGKSV